MRARTSRQAWTQADTHTHTQNTRQDKKRQDKTRQDATRHTKRAKYADRQIDTDMHTDRDKHTNIRSGSGTGKIMNPD